MLELLGARNKIKNINTSLEQAGKLGAVEKGLVLEAFIAIERANSIIKILEEKTKEGV